MANVCQGMAREAFLSSKHFQNVSVAEASHAVHLQEMVGNLALSVHVPMGMSP